MEGSSCSEVLNPEAHPEMPESKMIVRNKYLFDYFHYPERDLRCH